MRSVVGASGGRDVNGEIAAGGWFVSFASSVATQLARLTNVEPETIRPFTSRPPLAPTPLKLLARAQDAHRFADDTNDAATATATTTSRKGKTP